MKSIPGYAQECVFLFIFSQQWKANLHASKFRRNNEIMGRRVRAEKEFYLPLLIRSRLENLNWSVHIT